MKTRADIVVVMESPQIGRAERRLVRDSSSFGVTQFAAESHQPLHLLKRQVESLSDSGRTPPPSLPPPRR